MRAKPNQEIKSTFFLCQKKKTKWLTELPEGFACPFPTSKRLIFEGTGRFRSSGAQIWESIWNETETETETETEIIIGVSVSIRAILHLLLHQLHHHFENAQL